MIFFLLIAEEFYLLQDGSQAKNRAAAIGKVLMADYAAGR